MRGYWEQFWHLLTYYSKVELKALERFISPLLFSTIILVLFSFAFGELTDENVKTIFIAQTYLTVFFALQISFLRSFDLDVQDGAFDLLKSYPVSSVVVYLAKSTIVFITGFLILLPTILIALFFHSKFAALFLRIDFFMISVIALIGLVAIGVLLSVMTMVSTSRQILYPILYFPLTVPVLLSAVESSEFLLANKGSIMDLLGSWLGLLLVFDGVYIILGLLFFNDLIRAE